MELQKHFDELKISLEPFLSARADAQKKIKRLQDELLQVEERRSVTQRQNDELLQQIGVAMANGDAETALKLNKQKRLLRADLLDLYEISAHLKETGIPKQESRVKEVESELHAAIKARVPDIREQASSEYTRLLNLAFEFASGYDTILARALTDLEIKSSDPALRAGSPVTSLKANSPGFAAACQAHSFV